MLRTIGTALADEGHEVHVLSTVPSYRESTRGISVPKREVLGGITVRRVWVLGNEKANPLRRALNVLIYCAVLFAAVLRLRPDIVTAATTPPVMAAWTASLAAKITGAHFVYHMQDIHPEVSLYSGGRLGRGIALRILRFLDNQTLRRSSAIVVLSRDMRDSIQARGLGELPIHVINNFSLDLFDAPEEPPAELRKPSGKFRVIFAGNLGRFQNLPRLAEGISQLFPRYPKLELMFLGDGIALTELRQTYAGHSQVTFGPFLPFAQARVLIQEADVGLVALAPDIFRVAYPSKVTTYLRLGLPLLALVEPKSALARDLLAAGVAEIPASSRPQDIAVALCRLIETPREIGPADWGSNEELWAAWLYLFERLAGSER